jgi:ACS family allantoate permease-like MFS transporter
MTPQVLWFVLVGYCSLKYKNVRMWFMMISTLFPFVGVSLSSPVR